MRNINWDNIQEANDFPKVKPGGYIVRIAKVEDDEQKEYLKIFYDFVEGELKGYYADLYKSKGFWGGNFIRSYKEKALPFFKSFKTAVEESNPGYTFKNDPQSLVKKFVGIVLGEEEYLSNSGEKKTRTYVDRTLSGQRIRSGDFKVPEFKPLNEDDDRAFRDLSAKVADVFADDDEDPFANIERAEPPKNQGDLFADRYNQDDDDDGLPF